MPTTRFANQKWIKVHKNPVTRDFLQISNQEWMNVNKELSPYGLQLYLYLAANANGYEFSLSPQDAREQAGICRTAFYDYLRKLETHGYLVWKHTNTYDFYTVARPVNERTDPDKHESMIRFEDDPDSEQLQSNDSAEQTFDPFGERLDPDCGFARSDRDIVIDNKYNTKNPTNSPTDNAGTPRTPVSPDADASASPPRAMVEHSKVTTQPPKRRLFTFLDEDEFVF